MEFFNRIILEFSLADDWPDKSVLQKTSSSFGMYWLTLFGKYHFLLGAMTLAEDDHLQVCSMSW